MVGSYQPKQDPVAVSLATDAAGSNIKREADPMDKQPIIIHIGKMLEDFGEAPLRAVYMVVRQMHDLQNPLKTE